MWLLYSRFVLFIAEIPTLACIYGFFFPVSYCANVFVCMFFFDAYESFYTPAFVYVSWASSFLILYNSMDILLCNREKKKKWNNKTKRRMRKREKKEPLINGLRPKKRFTWGNSVFLCTMESKKENLYQCFLFSNSRADLCL